MLHAMHLEHATTYPMSCMHYTFHGDESAVTKCRGAMRSEHTAKKQHVTICPLWPSSGDA